jgi:3-phosphoshikimate 1-carboxyvinyltransferase
MDWLSSFPESVEVPGGRRLEGRLRVPPSKSVTHRMLVLALLNERELLVERPLMAEDTRAMLGALEALGWSVRLRDGAVALRPAENPVQQARIDCGAAGTMLRLLCGALSAIPGRFVLDGTARLRERPMGPLVEALRELGARIEYLNEEGFAPLEIRGTLLAGGGVELEAGQSSQYVSALLLAAARAAGPVEIVHHGLVSAPYVELSCRSLAEFGVGVTRRGSRLRVEPGLSGPGVVRVTGDDSAAAYPAAGAALTGGRVVLDGLSVDSGQGDRAFLKLLERMGADVDWDGDVVTVSGTGALTGQDVDLSSMPDQVPTLAALAPFARGRTRIRNVAHLRLKESDRLEVMRRELERVGARVKLEADGLSIDGLWSAAEPPSWPVTINPEDDHRIAMSLALVGLRRPGITIGDPAVVEKSYPSFWADLDSLLAE